jgi:hypothetical protein
MSILRNEKRPSMDGSQLHDVPSFSITPSLAESADRQVAWHSLFQEVHPLCLALFNSLAADRRIEGSKPASAGDVFESALRKLAWWSEEMRWSVAADT